MFYLNWKNNLLLKRLLFNLLWPKFKLKWFPKQQSIWFRYHQNQKKKWKNQKNKDKNQKNVKKLTLLQSLMKMKWKISDPVFQVHLWLNSLRLQRSHLLQKKLLRLLLRKRQKWQNQNYCKHKIFQLKLLHQILYKKNLTLKIVLLNGLKKKNRS